LREALKWVRRMEEQAKQHDPGYKDMFALAALKHSGEVNQTLFKWCDRDVHEEDLWTTDLLQTLVTVIFEKQFSSKFLVNLVVEFRRLIDPDGTVPFRKELLQPELTRLARRACQIEGAGKEAAVQAVVQPLIGLFLSSRHSFENFLQALEVINFFTRRGRV
jgi:CRISPR-associated protein Cmr2